MNALILTIQAFRSSTLLTANGPNLPSRVKVSSIHGRTMLSLRYLLYLREFSLSSFHDLAKIAFAV